jgi:hypothetical protein
MEPRKQVPGCGPIEIFHQAKSWMNEIRAASGEMPAVLLQMHRQTVSLQTVIFLRVLPLICALAEQTLRVLM